MNNTTDFLKFIVAPGTKYKFVSTPLDPPILIKVINDSEEMFLIEVKKITSDKGTEPKGSAARE